ncbi:hypothetical protein TRFO_24909 [Tritrichomonas foetus]|uniref:Uncharacterized protein n=1 Tax=Tritrichomonas foetus TaxID=1144522 RepID=A0A1J4K6Y6_9EUKA|nr:hypothetical protein TRFO_24909 [Tritrichomonas foetus]|eukprot:OHT06947.1 hypothetical protein TRFO_24909 [Tritrichomonas foetus]
MKSPKSHDLMKQQETIKNSMANVSQTLADLAKRVESWPKQLTDEDENDDLQIDIDLTNYSRIFGVFASVIAPLESGESYKKLVEIRNKVNESRKRLDNLKASKNIVGPEAVLEEATKLRPLLHQLRNTEAEFVYVLMHHWRAATQTISTDLHDVDNE